MTDIPEDIRKAAEAAFKRDEHDNTLIGIVARAILAERERCLACQPSTAENPNEDAYQRGRFDGIMEFARAIAGEA